MNRVISALTARTQFGQVLAEVAGRSRSFVIERRGDPKAVILGIRDYIRLAAPEPEILRVIGQASIKRGTNRIPAKQIDRIIKKARATRRNAGA